MRKTISTDTAPQAVGPYSQAIVAGGLVWVSGQIPLDPRTGAIVAGGIAAQTTQALNNVKSVLEASGSGLDRVVRVTVWLIDMQDYAAVNAVYADFFRDAPPTRVCVQVSGLPRAARVEIDAVALS